ncbi:MAG TPA: metallophosphoesterase [Sedimentisphaerales bacterium]|nr:metallophosphoesterase [Sedimentisphaerales bacterium]
MPTSEKIAAVVFLAAIACIYSLELFLIFLFALQRFTGGQSANILLSKPALCLHALAIIGIACFFYGFFVEPYWIEVKTITIPTEKLGRSTFRVVHISDLHCDRKPRNEKKLVRIVNSLRPDIIAFTGDVLNLNTASALPLFKETMTRLEASIGKFAVRGNVDIWYMPDLDFFGGTGFQLLDGKTVKAQKNGEEIFVSGLSCERPSAYRLLLQSVPENRFSIFLYHYSDLVEDLENLNVDLYLCGHTHGGQVQLPFYGAIITLSKFGKKYGAGMYTVDGTILYVNRGIGLEGGFAPRVRFLARPEITVFDIVPRKQPDS